MTYTTGYVRIRISLLKPYPYTSRFNSDFSDDKLSKCSYWKSVYQKKFQNIGFDWFLDSKDILGTVLHHIQQVINSSVHRSGSKRVSYLDLGCGTSDLPSSILQHCPSSLSLVLLDFVPEALAYQLDKLAQCKPLVKDTIWLGLVADVQKLPFECDTFNVIVDKGTMDALLKDRSQGHYKTKLMMSEILLALAPGGRYLQVSDEDPDSRLLFLEDTSEKCRLPAYSLGSVRPRPAALHPATLQPKTQRCTSSDCDLEKTFREYNLPTGKLLNSSDLLKYSNCILHHADNQGYENVCLQNSAGSNNSFTHQKLSPWSFQVLSHSSGREYFVYWVDKL